jgi:uncharacterized membrane protein
MSTPNPYAAPKAPLADEKTVLPSNLTPGGRARPAGNGWAWIADSWRFFMNAPGTWIAITLVLGVIFLALTFIPLLGGLALTLFTPVFVAGLMLGCRAIDEGGELEFRHLFAGFQNQLGNLVGVGAIYLGLSLVIMLVVMVATGASMFAVFSRGGGAQDPMVMAGALTTLALGMLIGLALFVPVIMLMWFAAPLVVFNQLGPVDAMKQSFSGCLRNIVPFLIYGIVMFVFSILASVPIGLGWLVLAPVTLASVYTGYKDIYLG